MPRPLSPTLKLALDFGPLAVFFLANAFAPVAKEQRIFVATAAFMAAIAVAVIVSRWRTGQVAPMLWFTAAIVAVFGGLTLWLHDETFIKVKPTIIYLTFAGLLGFGLATGRPVLKTVLGSSFPDLSATGWRILTRNWALFFLALAALNEAVWRSVSTDTWVQFKVWGITGLLFAFALAQAPLLTRHSGADE